MTRQLRSLRSGQNREILKTLHWIQNTLADGDGSINFGKYSIEERLEDVNGCQVTKVQAKDFSDPARKQFDLGALDPTSLEVSDGSLAFSSPRTPFRAY
jgi:hypothetical protein